MREIVKTGLPLVIITLVAALCLGFAHSVTREPIAEKSRQSEREALAAIFPSLDDVKDEIAVPRDGPVEKVLTGYSGGQIAGYAVFVSPNGYAGPVSMVVGLDPEGAVAGIGILSMSETPGLGANAAKAGFTGQFAGKTGKLAVVKSAPGDGEIQAVTSATVTSRAVTLGVNEALEFYEDYIRK